MSAGAVGVPTIEPVLPGIEAVVIPDGTSGFFSEDGFSVRAYLVGDRQVVLVDSGYAERLSIEAVSAAVAGRPVRSILLTHRHPDHGGGARALALRFGAPVLASQEEAATAGADPALEVRPIAAGECVEIEGRRLEVIAAPGHTRGHLVYYDRVAGVLFTGDTVLGDGSVVVGPPDGDMCAYLETLERLRGLDPLRVLLPGHGPPVWEARRKIERYLHHRRMREGQVLGLLERGGATLDEIVRAIYVPVVPERFLPLARVSALGTLEMLVAKGRVEKQGDRYRLCGRAQP